MQAAARQLHANCGYWGGVVPGNENEISGLIDKGVLGFKAFLTHSGIDDFPNVSAADLEKVMPIIARHNLPLLVHCELTGEQAAPRPDQIRLIATTWIPARSNGKTAAIALMIRLCENITAVCTL